MAENLPAFFIFNFFLHTAYGYIIYSKLPEIHGENLTVRSHLDFPHIIEICKSRKGFCRSNESHVCAARWNNGSLEYKDFENSCFLFLNNMCDYPGEEYNIVEGTWCKIHLHRKNLRRSKDIEENYLNLTNLIHTVNTTNSTDPGNGTENATTPSILRAAAVSRLYDLDTAFDYHACPLSCPDTYSPVCVSANRGAGKYFKFYTFINHCEGDVYYCKHYDEFAPAPPPYGDDEEDVNSSGLSWSYCGAFRYIQFARFSEILSSMGHYGWLGGHQRYSAILDPRDRRPGYG